MLPGTQPLPQLTDCSNAPKPSAHTDNFAEGLVCCERTLQTAGSDPQRAALYVPIAEVGAHMIIGRYAMERGWFDEAVVQADWCRARLGRVPLLHGYAQGMRAEAFRRTGRHRKQCRHSRPICQQGERGSCHFRARLPRQQLCGPMPQRFAHKSPCLPATATRHVWRRKKQSL